MKNIYTEDMKEITTSSSILKELITYDMVYVDKTSYIWRMVKNPARNFYFISRPRRFGKSLFCDTLKNVFEGNKELFKGLYIYDKYDFKPYPVLHFDFNNMDANSIEDFIKGLKGKIILQAEEVGIDIDSSYGPAMMFEMLIERLYRRDGEIVIIQDEYDAPLTSAAIGDPEMSEGVRKALNSFYATIKNKAGMIRFCFITGVVKLSNLSIFSAMNNLVDLSMDKEFSGAFGYTDEELEEYFGEGIDEFLEANPGVYESREEFREKIRDYYDGYRFSPESETRVYNPVSIGFFFYKHCEFDNYWEVTGVSALAVKLARKSKLIDIMKEENTLFEKSSFINFDISEIGNDNIAVSSVIALLYYSGYLTIQEISEMDDNVYLLGFPNVEIKCTFTENLINRFTGFAGIRSTWLMKFRTACYNGDEKEAESCIRDYFAAFPYDVFPTGKEKNYQIVFNAIFVLLSIPNDFEKKTFRGRIDTAVKAGKHYWIFELKIDRSADEALSQIEEKEYAETFTYLKDNGIAIHKVGISISSADRQIAEWKCIDA